ncbi:MAG: flagellar hook-basal body complex protein FliE [Treponema sp.]|nr:flagellar hook-basal body complex protein FliE [Treponema sp.]
MKINEMPVLQMQGFENIKNTNPLPSSPHVNILSGAEENQRIKEKSFGEYLSEAFGAMNKQQTDVAALERQLITDPDSVDIHDVTTAMAKAQMSMSLAKSVLDRIVTGWNEISTTR